MPGTSSQAEVQRRLAEMDARLRAMQEELERDLSVAESPAGADPAGAEPAEPVGAEPAEPADVEPADTGPGPGAPEPSVAVRGSAPARELRQRAPRLFPPAPPAPRQPQPEPQPAADPRLEAMCTRLLRSRQELLAGYEIALGHVAARPESGDAAAVTLAAGPFSRVEMVAEFERALAGLPHVAEVALRGYEGSDRAIIEVQLRG